MSKKPKKQPKFKGTDSEKREAYSKWREEWFKRTQGRDYNEGKPGKPK